MRVLSVASEVYPLVKTGGLADVTGALPPALARQGVAMRVLIPGYPDVMARISSGKVLHQYDGLLGFPARLVAKSVKGLDLIVLDAPDLFDRPGGPYSDQSGADHGDNWRRFGALSRAGADIAGGIVPDFVPDVVHAHDWQAAMTPAYMRYSGAPRPSVITIHNLAFQGQFPADIFGELGLPEDAFSMDGVEYYGGVGFLKAGLQSASAITTVSPSYADEIQTPEAGMGLDGLIQGRSDVLSGVVNGIDTDVWNPETDPHLAANFSARKITPRRANRLAVEERFGIDTDNAPLFAVISRLTWQKGMDLLAEIAGDMADAGAKLVILGTGDAALEGAFLGAASQHRGRIGVVLGYDEPLAHLVQGGADAILIPSRFEPCGLTQLCGQHYGTVPVVARTGGLADTIVDANTAALNAGVATGFQFAPAGVHGFRRAIQRAMQLHARPKEWAAIRRQGMKTDVSWDRSAARYAALYRQLAPDARGLDE
jgi:starch synthase